MMDDELHGYRQLAEVVQEAREWDIIVSPADGTLRIICYTDGCLYPDFHVARNSCDCPETLRMSSPIVDKNQRQLHEARWDHCELTGDGRDLLVCAAGSKVPVLSGKAYRLCGPRTPHPAWASASIWSIYAMAEQRAAEPEPLWRRAVDWIGSLLSTGGASRG